MCSRSFQQGALLFALVLFVAASFLGISIATPMTPSVRFSLRHDQVEHVPMPVQEPQVQRDLHDLDPPCKAPVKLDISDNHELQLRGANVTEHVLQAPSTLGSAPPSGDQQAPIRNQPRKIQSRILGGDPVPVGKFSFTTGLRRDASSPSFCGGSLITDRHVLTAAHCARTVRYVAVGTRFRWGSQDGVRIAVKSKTIHPQYITGAHSFDLMVLELAERVNTTKYRPVELARSIPREGIATVMGWGFTAEYMASYVLLQVDLKLISQDTCRQILEIDESMLCAGGESSEDACQGDSGGPLILQGSPDVLIGVVSGGVSNCGQQNVPGAYARIPIVANWIKAVAPGVKFR